MKICPACNQTYAGDSLNYCLNDGTTLTVVTGSKRSSAETVLLNRSPSTNPSEPLAVEPPNAGKPGRNSNGWMWSLLILGGLITICSVSIAFYAVMSKSGDSASNPKTADPAANRGNSSSPNSNANTRGSANVSPNANSAVADTSNVKADTNNTETALTIERYYQLKEGISYQDAAAILGKGEETSMSKGGGKTTNGYQWKVGNKTIDLRFENDALVARSHYGVGRKIVSGLTLAKFGQLKEGMSYKEAAAILGTEGVETRNSFNAPKSITYEWYPDNFGYVSVTFDDEKLVRKYQVSLK